MSDATLPPELPFEPVQAIGLQDEMESSFLDYAMSVITARALPDVRDGLKPVHRRIIWDMEEQGFRPDRNFVKCARVTGDTMANYHPHGNAAIYDALVRMAQPFSLRHPLIDFHGNYGSPDFGPAAERYCLVGSTRVRLTDGSSLPIAELVNLPHDSEADASFEVLDRDGKSVHVSKVFNSGPQLTKRLTTKSGFRLQGSHNHPVLCLVPVAGVPIFQWLRLDEITPGTFVCIARNAWTDVVPTARESALGLRASSTIDVSSSDAAVPEAVWRGGQGVKRAFLSAMLANCDLSVRLSASHGHSSDATGAGDPRSFITRSVRLARELQELLAEVGVIAARKTSTSAGESHALVPCDSGERVPYVASFLASELAPDDEDRALEWLGNFDRFERWETERLRIIDRIKDPEILATILPVMDSGYRFEPVASVEDAGIETVYSMRVDSDDHSFLAGAFVNHNTECRLAPLAMQLLADIDENTVDMVPNYDGTREQPTVLPARFPNLLVNGSQGIAVGMATNIPPHNLGEIIDATVHLIDNPEATPDDLMQFVKGPDFPTGASILGRAGIIDAYRTGRGSIKLRATAEIEESKRGAMQIVVTQLPYQTSCSAIAARIQELVDSGDLEGIADVNDESAGGKTQLVVTLKRDANANVVVNNLYKLTQLQTSFAVNVVALVKGVPRTLNLTQVLQGYIDHQVEVVTRRSEFRLKRAQERAHILEGRIKALDVIDEIIALIRASEDASAAKDGLMGEPFGFSEIQAIDILDMQLRRLTRLSRIDIETELAETRTQIRELQAILADPALLRGVIKSELAAIREKFATPRVCQIALDSGEMSIEDLVDDKELVVVMTEAQYVKAVPAGQFRTQSRGGRGVSGAKLKADDLVRHVIFTTAHAHLLFFSNLGKVYRLRALDIPERERTAKGMPIVNLLPLQPGETIQAIIDTRDFAGERYLFFATRQGTVKKTAFDAYDSSRRDGLIAINLRDGDELVRVIETGGSDDIFMVTRRGMTIRFSEDEVRPMGRTAAGVRGMRVRTGDEVVSVDVARDDTAILMITEAGYGKRTQLEHYNTQGRGGQGVIGIKLTGKKGHVVAAFMVGIDDEIVAVSSGGVTIRMPVREISSQGRGATGVRVMNLDDGQIVASVAPIFAADE
jgi:DNA gyrase subunit A